MPKITFMGAGSSVFAKSVLGDCMLTPALQDAHIALYDIDAQRLKDSRLMLDSLNANVNGGRARITSHLGVRNRQEALRGADYVVNAVQVGGYAPATVIDFEIPKKYGLRQTIADTLGIGGIFRALRTIPVVLDFCRDMEEVCPTALFLNYVNPMAMITAGILRGSSIQAIGLCHSVQGCAYWLCKAVGLDPDGVKAFRWKVAGINHQAWLLEVKDGERDLYPAIRKRAAEMVREARAGRLEKFRDIVRFELMLQLGYYITESSEHTAEYCPWFIKNASPELIAQYRIPLDEYPRRCIRQIEEWKERRAELVADKKLTHTRTHEYASSIMEAKISGQPFRVHGNVMNTGLITNLPAKACVEVPCMIDRNGINPCLVGDLPEQCAALNRTNINVQIMTVEAVLAGRKDYVYQAAMLDPHTAAELNIDQIRAMCDDLIKAHGKMLPKLK